VLFGLARTASASDSSTHGSTSFDTSLMIPLKHPPQLVPGAPGVQLGARSGGWLLRFDVYEPCWQLVWDGLQAGASVMLPLEVPLFRAWLGAVLPPSEVLMEPGGP
jgi:hypothetical protein